MKLLLIIPIVILLGACSSTTKVNYEYIPAKGEKFGLLDNKCLQGAREKAESQLKQSQIEIIDSESSIIIDQETKTAVLKCSVTVKNPAWNTPTNTQFVGKVTFILPFNVMR